MGCFMVFWEEDNAMEMDGNGWKWMEMDELL
jgi:hypothetical protein